MCTLSMDFLPFIYVIVFVSCSVAFGNAEDCKLSAAPPDPKSGCCGKAVGVNKSISGFYTQVSEYPWMGIIEYQRDNKTSLPCSAVLISGRYMLSAAQCFGPRARQIGTPTNIRLGEYDISNEGPDCVEMGGSLECNDGALKVPIEKVIVHPEYHKEHNLEHDIALIRLAKTVTSTDYIQPICLPNSDIFLNHTSILMWTAGWGAIHDNGTATRSRLHHVDLPFVDIDTCQSAFNTSKARQLKLGKGQICAGGEGKDSCKGDSGGPLMYVGDHATEVVGIVSFGSIPCGKIGFPGVYTKVYAYDEWIRAHIEA